MKNKFILTAMAFLLIVIVISVNSQSSSLDMQDDILSFSRNDKNMNLSVSIIVNGVEYNVTDKLKWWRENRDDGWKFGANITIPSTPTGTFIANNLQEIRFKVTSSIPLRQLKNNLYYEEDSSLFGFISKKKRISIDFSDILSFLKYQETAIDESGNSYLDTKPVPFSVGIDGNTAILSFDVRNIDFSAGQVIFLDPLIIIDDVNSYSSVKNNITTENYPLSHITLNDSSIVLYNPLDYSASTSYDYSENNNDATLTNQVFNSSLYGNGIEFNGVTSSRTAYIPDSSSLDLKSFTISLWFYKRGEGATANGGGGIVVYPFMAKGVGEADGDGRDVNFIFGVNTTGKIRAGYENQSGADFPVINATTSILNNQWYHTVFMRNDSGSYVFLNGVQEAYQISPQLPANNNIRVGIGMGYNSVNTITGAWNGTLDDIIIFNRSLSESEIQSIYNNQTYKFRTPASQIFQNISISQIGWYDKLNVTTNSTNYFNTNISLRVLEYDSLGINIQNSSYVNITSGNNIVTNFIINNLTYNVSLEFLYIPDSNNFYSPVISDNILVESSGIEPPDTVIPLVNFTYPTPVNNSYTNQNSRIINLTVIEDRFLKGLIYNWNGTNHTVLDNTVLLAYNFNNLSALSENDTKILDVAYGKYNGTAVNADYNSSGRYGGSWQQVIADNGFVQTGLGNNWNFSAQPVSVSFWALKQSSCASTSAHVFGTHVNNNRFYIRCNNGVWGYRLNGEVASDTTVSVSLNQWYHVALIMNGTSSFFYINGVNQKNQTYPSYLSQSHWMIGNFNNSGQPTYLQEGWGGLVDNLIILNRSLSPEEISQLYYSDFEKINSTLWSYNSNQSLAEGIYTYYAVAKDNWENNGTSEFRTLNVDFTNPDVSIISPANNSYSNQNVTFSCNASDSAGLSNISLYLPKTTEPTTQEVTFYNEWIPNNSLWKYNDSDTYPTGWETESFNDSLWKSGYDYLGYETNPVGEGINTTVSIGTYPYATYYFRKNLYILNSSKVINMSFNVDYDDAYAVYINGNLINASNFTTDWASQSAVSTPAHNSIVDGSGATAPVFPKTQLNSTHLGYLHDGNNTVAVAIKQSSATSTDIAFRLRFEGYENRLVNLFELNQTNSVSGTQNSANFSVILAEGNYEWFCSSMDLAGNHANSSVYLLNINQPPSVIFNIKIPSDINSYNIVGIKTNISYNITDDTQLDNSTIKLYYKINSTYSDCNVFVNGTSVCGFSSLLYNYTSSPSYYWLLDDNIILPATYNYNENLMENTPHNTSSISTASTYVSVNFLNVSNNTQYNAFEIMANRSSGIFGLDFYYCNSSYAFASSPASSSNCYNFYTLASNVYNHTHTQYSSHMVIPFIINRTSGNIGTVKVTDSSNFMLKGTSPSAVWDYYYVQNYSRINVTRKSFDGVAWTTENYTVDSHLHQYSDNDSFWYYACANDTMANQNCSSLRQDLIQIGNLSPIPSNVYSPTAQSYSGFLNINYTSAVSPNEYPISYYNISLYTTSESYVQSINNNGLNLSYYWDSNLAVNGNYKVGVTACDSLSQCSTGFSLAFIIDNNIPSGTLVSPSNNTFTNIPVQNFTVNVTDNMNLSNATLYIINGTNYTVFNETNILFNETTNVTGTESLLGTVYNFLTDGIFSWFYDIYDLAGNFFRTVIYTFSLDTSVPSVNITYPIDYENYTIPITNMTYDTTGTVTNCWYSLNGGANVSTSCGTAVTGIVSQTGNNIWKVYANNSFGNMSSDTVNFTSICQNPDVVMNVPSYPYADLNTTYTLELSTFYLNVSIIQIRITDANNTNSTYNLSWTPNKYYIDLLFEEEGNYPFVIYGDGICQTLSQNITGIFMVRSPYYVTFELFKNKGDSFFSFFTSDNYENNFAYMTAEFTQAGYDDFIQTYLVPLNTRTTRTSVFHSPYVDGSSTLKLWDRNDTYSVRLIDGIVNFDGVYSVPNITDSYGVNAYLGDYYLNGSNMTYAVYVDANDIKPYRTLFNWGLVVLLVFAGILTVLFAVKYPTASVIGGLFVIITLLVIRIVLYFWTGN